MIRQVVVPLVGALVLVSSPLPPSSPVAKSLPVDEVVAEIAAIVEFGKDGKPVTFLPNLWHMSSGAQGCPVSKTEALTARHVAVNAPLAWSYPRSAYGGTLVGVWVDTRRDVGMVRIADGPAFQRFYAIAEEPPQVGDDVFLQGYDNGEGWTTKWYEAEVINVYAGNVDFDTTPGPGSSGSCVLNGRGEVVAINYAAYQVNPLSKLKGSAALVTPPWTPGASKWSEDTHDKEDEADEE